jgi:putative endopeptidase
MRHRIASLAIGTALALAGGATASTNERGLDRRNIAPDVAACSDFSQYGNGGWIASNPIPAEFSTWGIGNEMRERNLELLRQILEDGARKGAAPGSNARKIGDFYASGMDEAAIEKSGHDPIKPDLATIDALADNAAVAALIARWHAQGLQPLFAFGALADLKDSGNVIGYATQGGLGLPEREHYLKSDSESVALRAQYRAHVQKLFELAGIPSARAKVQAGWVLDLETRLARASLDQVAMRDPGNYYNIQTVAAATAHTPHFDWRAYFAALELDEIERFSLAQPAFFSEVDRLLADLPTSHWQAYLRWNLVDAAAPYLSSAFVEQDFAFKGKTLTGAKVLRPRWKRVMDTTSSHLSEALGEMYVARTFPPEAKAKGLALVQDLQAALKSRLAALDWMSDETKARAMEKFATFSPKIGYPDRWRDYSRLEIKPGHYADNVRAGTAFEARRDYAKIGKPVDRSEWGMAPQTVNAYYNPLQNEIVFPAAMMQPPFFDPAMDDALNYGAMGSVIGHELMHGFDDQGSRFDASGNFASWWTEDDRKQFEARTRKLVEQFDGYVAIDALHVNGELTLGENIADLGGLLVAYDAFQGTAQAKAGRKIDGLTPDQRFFLAFAQGWRRSYRPEALKLQVNTDPHAPANFRVIGPVSNMASFAQAFDCTAGDAMVNPASSRVQIW